MASILKDTAVQRAAAGLGALAAAYGLYRIWAQRKGADTSAAVISTTSSSHDQSVYETEKAVQEYLLLHFGADKDILPYSADIAPTNALHFPERTARICLQLFKRFGRAAGVSGPLRVFDVGCAIGGSAFEFSREASAVMAIDFSHAFIDTAERLRNGVRVPYAFQVEGDITAKAVAERPAGSEPAVIRFEQGDACALAPVAELGGPFEIIHAANLLCRLPEPRKFLNRLPEMTAPNGIVVFISPYSWLPQYTKKSHWVGAKYASPETPAAAAGGAGAASAAVPLRSRDELIAILAGLGFRLVHEEDCPWLIREHARKFNWGCSHITAFQRVGEGSAPATEVV